MKSSMLTVLLGSFSCNSSAGSSQIGNDLLYRLWSIGNQVLSDQPELVVSLSLATNVERWELLAHKLVTNEITTLREIKINSQAVSLFKGWVLPIDLLNLGIAVRKKIGPIL